MAGRNGTSAKKHICFYSNRCEWSKAFLTELSQTLYKDDFMFICVDASPTRPTIPSWLKKVPTLVISGEQEPRTDGDVMNWVYEKRLISGKQPTPSSGTSNSTVTPSSGEPDAFIDTEMGGGYGDSYSFIDSDTSTAGNGGMSMAHNFSFLGGNMNIGTKEGSPIMSTSNSGGKRSKKEEMLDAQLEAYKRDRESGIPKKIARS